MKKKKLTLLIFSAFMLVSYLSPLELTAQNKAELNKKERILTTDMTASYMSKAVLKKMIDEKKFSHPQIQEMTLDEVGNIEVLKTTEGAESLRNELNQLLLRIDQDYAALKAEGHTYDEIIDLISQKNK